MHKFDDKLEEGIQAEAIVGCAWQERGWEWVPSGYWGRLLHADAHALKGGTVISVEVKADARAVETGNAWVEIVSKENQGAHVRGWAYTCGAQVLAYYIPQRAEVLLFHTVAIKLAVHEWLETFPVKTAHNPGYVGRGIIVPLDTFSALAYDRWENVR